MMDGLHNGKLPLSQEGDLASLKEHQHALYVLLQELERVCREKKISYFLFAGSLLGAVRHQGFIPWDDDLDVLMLREDYEKLFREAGDVIDSESFFLQEEFSEHWPMFFSKLRLNGTTCLEKYHPKDPLMHQGVYMDIFPCDNCYDSRLGRILQFLCAKVIIAKGLFAEGYESNDPKKLLFMQLCRVLPFKPFYRIVRGPKKRGQWVHSFLGGSSKFSRSIYPAEYFEQAVPVQFEAGQYPAPSRYRELLTILYGDYMKIPPEEDRKCKQHAILVDLTRSWELYADYRDGMKFDSYTRSIR